MGPALYREWRLVLTALGYFTRWPVSGAGEFSQVELNAALRYFPAIGLLVGACSGFAHLLAAQIFPASVAVVLALVSGVLLTGGFHEDGLADTCDGLGGGWTRERVLEIMKDSRLGSFGALGLVLVLLGKYAALTSLALTIVPAVFIAGHAWSRFMAASVVSTQSYVREDDSARARLVAGGIGLSALGYAGLFALAPLFLLGAAGVAGALAAFAARAIAGTYLHRRLGGYTGDTLGAVQQVAELAFYLGVLGWGVA
ncbi:MAG: adenosylcobinamide-GDP ribazoletransferase [Betaproteobacteria bacterium]|nr:adenosylcobinamide-GDP ribazoletransferase [Betaproteobacteria bacterium]